MLADGRAKEAELDAMCVELPADPDGRWHAKDHLAHSAWWRQRNAKLFDAVRSDGTLPPPLEDNPQNALIYQSYRDRSLEEVRDFASSSWEQLTRAVEALSEGDLLKPHPYAANQLLWQEVCGTSFYHTGEHLTWVYDEAGDERGAEATQRWMRDLHVRVAPDDRQRATAEYNLGCFYAKRGRGDDALPLLRKSFALRRDLIEWAQKDTDLDPIRQDPRVIELLGSAPPK